MSKINDGNISGQSELLRSTIARLINYIRGYKLKNRAETAAKLSMLQAELGSADKNAEPDRPVADVDLDAVWRDVACQIADQKREILVMDQQVKEQEKLLQSRDWQIQEQAKEIQSRDRQIQEQAKEIQSRDRQIISLQDKLNEINNSVTWRMARKLHRIIDRILPHGSKRRFLAKRVLINMAHPARLIKYLNPYKLINYFIYLNKKGPAYLEGVINSALSRQENSWALPIARARWLERQSLNNNQLNRQKYESLNFNYRPKISIITPVWNTDVKWLKVAIESVRNQTYDNWELCIADGNSTKADIKRTLKQYAAIDQRIKIKLLSKNKGAPGNSNEALSLATGDFIGLMDSDDELTPDALFEIIKLLNDKPEADLIYSDEVLTNETGDPTSFVYRPDFSLDYLLSHCYFVHFIVIRKEILDNCVFREEFVISQDYDLYLRIVSKTRRILHIPRVLYKWRTYSKSTGHKLKSRVIHFSSKALSEFLQREGIKGSVIASNSFNFFRIKREIIGYPLVSIIIPIRDKVDYLKKCVDSIESKTTYRNYEVIIINNQSQEEATYKYLDHLKKTYTNYKIIQYDEEFNYSKINNYAVQYAIGTHLLFLNSDIEVISNEWLSAMLEQSQREEVAFVGAKLLFPDNRIQHVGVVIGLCGCAEHIYKFTQSKNDIGYLGHFVSIRNWSAVTAACMMVKRSLFEKLSGFDVNIKISWGDTDICLRAIEKGYVNVVTPYAELYHYESVTRTNGMPFNENSYPEDREYFEKRWKELIIRGDPYYNPNLPKDTLDISAYVNF